MQPNIQIYIDAYSNFILNHLLLAENPTGINVVQLSSVPSVQTFPSSSNGLLYTDLDIFSKGYTPIKLGTLSIAPTYEISLYFLCKEPKFSTMSADTFYESYYQLTEEDYLIMTLYSEDTPIKTSKLQASSLITCSLNLTLNHDYELYRTATEIIRKMVIRFYSPILTKALEAGDYPRTPVASPESATTTNEIYTVESPSELLSKEELEALSHVLAPVSEETQATDTDNIKED